MSTPVLDVHGLAFAYPDGHQALFFRLAVAASGGDEAGVGARLQTLLAREAEVVRAVGLRAAIH